MGHFVMYEIDFFGNKFGKLAKFTRLQQKKMTSQQTLKVYTVYSVSVGLYVVMS